MDPGYFPSSQPHAISTCGYLGVLFFRPSQPGPCLIHAGVSLSKGGSGSTSDFLPGMPFPDLGSNLSSPSDPREVSTQEANLYFWLVVPPQRFVPLSPKECDFSINDEDS